VESDNFIERMRKKSASARQFAGIVLDEERILNLPIETYPPGRTCVTKWSTALACNPKAPPLFEGQALSFECISRSKNNRGAVLALPVGYGKTLVALLAGTVLKSQRVLLLVPASLKKQMFEDIQKWKHLYRVHPNISVMSYQKLSRPESAFELKRLSPDLIVMDEAHWLASQVSVTTKRIFAYCKSAPKTKFIAMSGTLIQQSLNKYAHIVELALRGEAPVPTSYSIRQRWEALLNPHAEHTHNDWCQIKWLVGKEVPLEKQKEAAQLAFQRRFKNAPGVIVASDQSKVSASIIFSGWHPCTSSKINDALHHLRKTWQLPNGDFLADALEYARAQKQIALGFYYRWDWPNGPDAEWLEARRAWNATVRNVVALSRPGRDSPALVFRAAQRRECSPGVLRVFDRWNAVKDRPTPPTVTEVICDSVLTSAVAEANKSKSCLLWYVSVEGVGSRLQALGMKVLRPGDPVPNGETVALPIRSFGQGVDGLQYNYSDNLVLETPSSAKVWEQMCGRTHRVGSTAHEVTFKYLNAPPYWRSFQKALVEAEALQNKTGQRQKLLIGSHADLHDGDLYL